MGSASSTRWKGHRKRLAVELCRRINVREAAAMGQPTATRPAPNHAAWPYCLCAQCGRLVRYLYQRPDAEPWLCRHCHNLEYTSRQMKGSAAALAAAVSGSNGEFRQWLETRPEWIELRQCDIGDLAKPGCPVAPEDLAIEQQIFEENLRSRLRPEFLDDFQRQWKARHRTYNRRKLAADPRR